VSAISATELTALHIRAALDAVETEADAPILFAVESGSRAWGFPSPDSDWDVRFVYARPTRWYVSLSTGPDVLERMLPGDLDLAGWDARKAILLLLKGNPVLGEWLRSPILYRSEPELLEEFWRLAALVPARHAAIHHYRSMARQHWDRYLRDGAQVNLKKYLYALRPALALRWLAEHEGGELPMDLPRLLDGVALPAEVRDAAALLLDRKHRTAEIGMGPRLPALDRLIEATIVEAQPSLDTPSPAEAREAAETLFRRTVAHADAALGDLPA
jgi:hypothetical protein